MDIISQDNSDTRRGVESIYADFGIGSEGAVVVVRPDGYVGLVTSLHDIQALADYFTGFLRVKGRVDSS